MSRERTIHQALLPLREKGVSTLFSKMFIRIKFRFSIQTPARMRRLIMWRFSLTRTKLAYRSIPRTSKRDKVVLTAMTMVCSISQSCLPKLYMERASSSLVKHRSIAFTQRAKPMCLIICLYGSGFQCLEVNLLS